MWRTSALATVLATAAAPNLFPPVNEGSATVLTLTLTPPVDGSQQSHPQPLMPRVRPRWQSRGQPRRITSAQRGNAGVLKAFSSLISTRQHLVVPTFALLSY